MGVSCGTNHTAAFTKDGQLYCWGWGEHGRLGLGDEVGAMDINNSRRMMLNLVECAKGGTGWPQRPLINACRSE
jgi:alpha-tubulin suppressor-like RCC1 family protein